MARKRVLYPIDTSDRLANVVVASISTLIVALLGLILWMTSTGERTTETAAPAVPPTDVASPTQAQPPVVPPTVAATPPADEVVVPAPDGVGDATDIVPGGATPPPTGREAVTPAPDVARGAPTTTAPDAAPVEPTPPPDGDVGSDRVVPNPGRGSGLFSRDDPDRMPAITVSSTPRGERVRIVDLDGDGVDERVWAAIVADQVVIRVDRQVDGAWEPGRTRGAAAADRLVALRVDDLTGDGRLEVYTKQWVATQGESVTLWSYAGDGLRRMPVTGGCWSGTNTFGLIGADVQPDVDGEPVVVAICKDKPLPPQQWPSAVYRWRDGRWTFDRMVGQPR